MGEDRVRGAFRSQGKSCAMLGSPFMARLMPLIGARLTADGAVGARILDWPGDVGPAGQSVPLRLAGALHALVLSGDAPALAAVYPPNEVREAALWSAVADALHQHEARIMAALDSPPQTNEIRRAAIILPALWQFAARFGLPITLLELGASAGLNLWMDRFAVAGPWPQAKGQAPVTLTPEWRGTPPPPQPLHIAGRRGVDLHPVDLRQDGASRRLLSYLWPDQPERIARTRAAMALVEAPPDAGDAAPWLEAQLDTRPEYGLTCVYSTIAWQYFPPATQARARAALERAGAAATSERPLAWLAFEADGVREGAPLTLRLWDGGAEDGAPKVLARADFHGRWIDWHG